MSKFHWELCGDDFGCAYLESDFRFNKGDFLKNNNGVFEVVSISFILQKSDSLSTHPVIFELRLTKL